jgi:hypothetical protein
MFSTTADRVAFESFYRPAVLAANAATVPPAETFGTEDYNDSAIATLTREKGNGIPAGTSGYLLESSPLHDVAVFVSWEGQRCVVTPADVITHY